MADMEFLRYADNSTPSSHNIPLTHQFIHHRFFADHNHELLIVKSNRQKTPENPIDPELPATGETGLRFRVKTASDDAVIGVRDREKGETGTKKKRRR
jgi:hypothetical protein